MDDIRPAVRDDVPRSMTYAEIAAVRGISADSAERLVRRRRWPKQLGNDGTVRVLVPGDEAQPASARNSGRHPVGRQAGYQAVRPVADILPAIRDAIREAIQPLAEQLQAANRRADVERARADRAEQQAAALQTELAEARVASELAKYATAEVADLRRRLDAEAEERRRLAAVLADRSTAPPPRRWRIWGRRA